MVRERPTCTKAHNMFLNPPHTMHRSTTPPLPGTSHQKSNLDGGQRSRSRSFHNLYHMSLSIGNSSDQNEDSGTESKKKVKKSSTLLARLSPIPKRKSLKTKRGSSATASPALSILNPLLSGARLAEHIGAPAQTSIAIKNNSSASTDTSDSNESTKENNSSDSDSCENLQTKKLNLETQEGLVSEPFLQLLRFKHLDCAKPQTRPRSPSSAIRNSLKRMTRGSLKNDHH